MLHFAFPAMATGHPDAFPATRHSVVRAIASDDAEVRAHAYEALIRSYWRPVYAYIRLRWRQEPERARDLTQEFFATDLEKQYLARFDPSRARFRTFLRTCLDGFLAKAQQSAARLKRGGELTFVPLDFAGADAEIARHPPATDDDPDAWFHREWVRGVLAAAVETLRARCDADNRARAFLIFSRYDLAEHDDHNRPTYAALARECGLSTYDVTNQLAWARRAFRDAVLDTLRALCASDEEFRAEARDLLGITPP